MDDTILAERKALALETIAENADEFRDDFPAWIDSNFHIWTRFEDMALQIARKREHYSARTIFEVIRFHTMLQENGSAWKLNDHFAPDCSRLWTRLHPAHSEFFETRRRKAALMEVE